MFSLVVLRSLLFLRQTREASSSMLSEAARSARDNGDDVFYDAEEYDGEGDAAPDAQMLRNTVTAC